MKRGMVFFAKAGKAVYPERKTAIHITEGFKFGNLGAVARQPTFEHGRQPHQAPMAKGRHFPEGVYLPQVQASVGETPAKFHMGWRKSVSMPSLDHLSASQPLPRTSGSPPAVQASSIGGEPSRNLVAVRGGPSFPASRSFESSSGDLASHADNLNSKYCLVSSARDANARQKSPARPGKRTGLAKDASASDKGLFGAHAVAAADIGGKGYTNSSMNRFYIRHPTGGFYCGSGLPAPKVSNSPFAGAK